jgi:hypothetical protein
VQASLLPDEEVLWSGKPDPSALLTKRDAFFIPLSILWAGFAVFWEWSVVAMGAPVLFTIWGIPFVAFGLYISPGDSSSAAGTSRTACTCSPRDEPWSRPPRR